MGKVIYEEGGSSYESAALTWNKITHSLMPELETLPPEDYRYFAGKIKFLIGKEVHLSNIPTHLMYLFFQWADRIYYLTWYPMLVPTEYIRRELGRLLSRLGLLISENALGWKYGPMGFQQQHIKQEVIQPGREG